MKWVITKALEALVVVSRTGLACAVLAGLLLLFQVMLFFANTHRKGLAMYDAVRKYFDPDTRSYAKAIVERTGTRRMNLAGAFAIAPRKPSSKEIRMLMVVSTWTDDAFENGHDVSSDDSGSDDDGAEKSHRRTASKRALRMQRAHAKLVAASQARRQLDADALQAHIALRLQYTEISSAPSFLGAYAYAQVFAYLIYFGLLFLVLCLPFQELVWLLLLSVWEQWVPVVFILVVKALIDFFVIFNLDLRRGQYAGLPHPRCMGTFDAFRTLISSLLGWVPAAVRVVISFIFSLLYVPRLDVELLGAVLDSTGSKYRGLLESWRLQMEYRCVSRWGEAKAREKRQASLRRVTNPARASVVNANL